MESKERVAEEAGVSSSTANAPPVRNMQVRSDNLQPTGCFQRRQLKQLLKKFNEDQAELLEEYEKDQLAINGVEDRPEPERNMDSILNKILFALNIFLFGANLTASILSGSLSIISTFVDTAMDLTTSIIIGVCLHKIKTAGGQKYPRGRESLEIIAVILSSFTMGIANMVIIMKSVTAIVEDKIDPNMTLVTLIILVTGCSLKFVLMLICFKRGTPSCKACSFSSEHGDRCCVASRAIFILVQVLAMDMRNDIATSVVAITAAMIGDHFWKYADPIGAMLVCGVIAFNWFSNAMQFIPWLTGVSGDRHHVARILNVVTQHDDRILKIDHLMLYHKGEMSTVELHIVMNEDLPLKVTHDISHLLETKLNRLPFVERSFVHCDYDCDGDH